jgi:Holliday junction resolvasome RuvABC endonuclease subunit
MKVTGLDLSMTATGLTHTVEQASCTHLIKPKKALDLRLPELKIRILEQARGSDLVLIEGYLNRSMSAGITGMVHGTIRTALLEEGISYAVLPPASLKKFATGRGGASKTEMALAALKRADLEFRDDNECDSFWLWVAANLHLGNPVLDMPKAQREALDKIVMGVDI